MLNDKYVPTIEAYASANKKCNNLEEENKGLKQKLSDQELEIKRLKIERLKQTTEKTLNTPSVNLDI